MTLLGQHDPQDLVAFGAEGDRTALDLRRDMARLAAALPEASPGSHVFVVSRHDGYALLAATLAAWARGHAVALCADQTRSSILEIRERPEVVAMLHDTLSGAELRVGEVLAKTTAAPPVETRPGDVTFFRHGRAWPCPWEALLAEATALLGLFPADRPRVAATVPLTHRFSLVSGALRALLRGGALGRGRAADAQATEWLCAPPLLQDLPPGGLVFCALGEAPPGPAEALGPRLVDLYCDASRGVTEWRRPGHDSRWRTLDGALCPHDDPEGVQTRALLERPGVLDAAVLDPEPLRALVVLDGTPGDLPGGSQTRPVDRIPRDPYGRLDRVAALRLFGQRPDGRPLQTEVVWGAERRTEDAHHFDLEVPRDYAWYDGHFPGYPVMSGVVQLHEVVLPCVRRAHPELGALQRLSQVKFLGRIRPGDAVEVRLSGDGDPLRFELRVDDRVCAAGRMYFECPPTDGAAE